MYIRFFACSIRFFRRRAVSLPAVGREVPSNLESAKGSVGFCLLPVSLQIYIMFLLLFQLFRTRIQLYNSWSSARRNCRYAHMPVYFPSLSNPLNPHRLRTNIPFYILG